MYIILNYGSSPLHQINIWCKAQRTNFIIVLKSTSNKELQAGTYVGKDIETAQFALNGSSIGFSVGNDDMFETILEVSKYGKTYEIVFTANTLSESEQLIGYKVTWSGTLPVTAVRQF
jgi:hypothetical protein